MVEERKSERLPPYVSYATWKKLMHGLANFLPDQIDASVFTDLRFSGSDKKKLRAALRYLSLVDDNGVPTESLHALVEAHRNDGDKAAVLNQLLEEGYPFLHDANFNLATATWKQLTDRFESLGVSGDTQRACTSFFLHMAVEAGKDISPHLSSRTKSGLGRPSIVRRRSQEKRKSKQDRSSTRVETSSPEPIAARFNDVDMAVAGVLNLLPQKGQKWDKDSKRRFKVALEAVLDAVYPDDQPAGSDS